VSDTAPAAEQALIVENYTDVSRISKRVRKIHDMVIPLRRGLGQDQVVAGFLTLVALAIIFFTLIRPTLQLLNVQPNWVMYVIYFVGPVILVGQKISAPMPSGKTISGTMTSFMRFHMDDPIHRRGIPQPKRPARGRRLHYAREWVPSNGYTANSFATGMGDDALTYTGRADLEKWMATQTVAHREEQVSESQAKKAERQAQLEARITATDTSVTFDTED